jgi:threonine dehydrogenase-like Zn-dependent dehydrogenase
MQGAVLYGPYDIRYVERAAPTIIEPTDAIIRLSATCVCGSDLWPYRAMDERRAIKTLLRLEGT